VSELVRLRRYTADDENTTATLWITTWQAVYPEIDFAASDEAMRTRWRDEIVPPATVTLAAAGERIVGLVTVDLGTGYVDQLAVVPEMWGTSVGAMLLNEAKRLSPAMVYLRVNQDNARAIRFYDKHGFFKDGEAFNERIGRLQFIMRWRAEPA
jgi:putative acetyltransferase